MHLATMATRGKLPKHACRECPPRSPCRHSTPLNGRDAATEYTRNLRPWAKALVHK